ncbi:MAG: SET domain-containing protein-lysine N-methyltransferase [Bacteroidetes bacterium]|nr:MAG: SET domain-containing protein-lysine N-methyltransferase [Bacteroidota bacterium]
MIKSNLFIGKSESRGRGVFTSSNIVEDTIIEIAPVVVMSAADRKFLDQTTLHDYIFEWGEQGNQCCMALGYVPIYNHSYQANCEYEMDYEEQKITIKTVRFVQAGEELFINYNGDWNNKKKIWFDVV